MKARGIILVDYELPNGFREAADELDRLEKAMQQLVEGNPRVVYYDCDLKERRGEGRPDIRQLKIRSS
jgi:hypothetical protein